MCCLFVRSRRSPRGGKLPFSEGNTSDGTRVPGMSGGANNESNNGTNQSNTGANNATTDNPATSSTSNASNASMSNVSLRVNPFENFSVAMDTESKC